MIKILQYGEGNFLRTFVDAYFNTLNNEGANYEIYIVKPIKYGSLENFNKQNNKYHIVLRGTSNDKDVEDVYKIESIKQVIDPFVDSKSYYALATDKDLKIIVSNTTESGICFNNKDDINGFEDITYPAKLTKFLYERFKAGLDGVYLMPVELIDNNAEVLKDCVSRYIELWSLPEEFKIWNENNNFYCNTLVDRIVSGHPKDEQTKNHLFDLIGEEDHLVSVGEPFGLWAVEDKGQISKYIVEGLHNIEVVLTKDIAYYKKRKVRVLNGSHTNLVATGLMLGAITVYDCMKDEILSSFIEDTLKNEINPFVSDDIKATTMFVDSIKSRFLNPYINHQLTSIALNSISKWKARVLPSFIDYYKTYKKYPKNLTIGFSYLMALYSSIVEVDGKFVAQVKGRKIEIQDDINYLTYFSKGNSISNFMSDISVWGMDLTEFDGFEYQVSENVNKIKKGVCLI